MSFKRPSVLCIFVFALSLFSLHVLQAEQISISMQPTNVGESSIISFNLQNSSVIHGLRVPLKLTLNPEGNFFIDSIARGQRVADIRPSYISRYDDSGNIRVQIIGTNGDLPPGDGEIFRIHFHTEPSEMSIYLELDTLSQDLGYWFSPEILDSGGTYLEFNFESFQGYLDAPFVCGDLNLDYTVNQNDILEYINRIFGLNPEKVHGPRGDVDCDLDEDFVDLVYLVRYLYRSGPGPCELCK